MSVIVDDLGQEGDGFEGTQTTQASYSYINESGLPDEEVYGAIKRNREIASIIEKWSQSLNSEHVSPTLNLFHRSKYNGKSHIFSDIAKAAWACENDDILSTLGDVVEGLMFQKCRFELYESDQEDMWNQWAGDVDLDSRLREMGRELYKVSQFYVGLWWEDRVYAVRDDRIQETIDEFEREKKERDYKDATEQRDALIAANAGNPEFIAPPELPEPPEDKPGRGNRRRKKKFPVRVPTQMTVFDPTKVVPVGQLMFGRERFAYVAARGEDMAFSSVMAGETVDGTVLQLIERKYIPSEQDKEFCAEIGVDHNRLWLFREDAVFRHSLTRAQYERWAPVRMKAVMEILDMKQHLRASDRASLVGNTNFIVVITKGTDKLPAKAAEIQNLQEQARTVARLPVLVGDHRLNVEIVSPSVDNTLTESRYQVLDSRLVHKALQTFMPIQQGGNSSSGVSEMSRVVARGLESRRHMLVRSLERSVFRKILEANEDVLDEMPDLAFTPKRITLDFSADVINAILKLRDRGDISRETMLEEVDFDQDVEVLRRAQERLSYDRVFESGVPHSSPVMNPHAAGAQPPPPPGQPGPPGSNVGPAGQPRTEGGRPSGATDKTPRKKADSK